MIIDCTSTAKLDEMQNDCLTQTLIFLQGVEMKKWTSAWDDSINSFILKEQPM